MDSHNKYLIRQNHLWGLGFDWDSHKENKNVNKYNKGLSNFFPLCRKRENSSRKL